MHVRYRTMLSSSLISLHNIVSKLANLNVSEHFRSTLLFNSGDHGRGDLDGPDQAAALGRLAKDCGVLFLALYELKHLLQVLQSFILSGGRFFFD